MFVYPRREALAVQALVAALILAWPACAWAQQDYHDKDFSVRLAPAFLRFTEVSAMGGETAANRYSSAINPASVDWFPLPGKLGIVAAPYYSQVIFDNGTDLHLYGESATVDARDWGVFQPTISQIRTNQDRDRATGLEFDYSVDTVQLQWGKRSGDFAIGAAFNFASADIHRDGRFITHQPSQIGTLDVPVSVDSKATAESYRWRFGGLYQPIEKLLTGMIFEYGFQPFRSRTRTVIGPPTIQGQPLPIPPTVTEAYDDGVQHQFVLRPGVSYEFAKLSSVYADYQFGAFFNQRDQLIDQRFNAGVEYRLLENLLVRAGPSMDVRGNFGFSCGASVFLCEWASIDLAYQNNMLPELHPEFGRSQTIQAALALRF